jgi:hypothetical protein
MTADPHRIGDYRLIRRLGAGGMGQVFLGRSPAGLPVAVKEIHPGLAADPVFRARFAREVQAARAVSGAFTAPVIDADPATDPPWLVTQFLPGLSLQEAVESCGPLPPPAVATLGAGLAEALRSIHAAGVVHRDLKPSNIMLCPDGPRVIDFGIAHTSTAETITGTGAVTGSPGYMSPEQALGTGSGPAGDVFSLGGVLTFAATGAPPYGLGDPQTQVYRIVHEPPRLDAVPDPRLRGILAACMSRDPAARPTADQVLGRLAGAPPQGTAWLPAPVVAEIGRHTRVLPRRRLLTRLPVLIALPVVLAALVYAVALLTGSGGDCDHACQDAGLSPAAFYATWSADLEGAAHLCDIGSAIGCADQAATLPAQLTKEIALRADKTRYARTLADVARLNTRLTAHRSDTRGIGTALLTLDDDLFAASADRGTDETATPH